jgi:hypothetical protein
MKEVQQALRERYSNLHPLLFQRSLEKASSNGELFDILEGIPSDYPIVWDDDTKSWIHTEDMLQSKLRRKEENA